MLSYLLLRDNLQSGPFSLEELKAAGIMSTDQVWIEGKSTAWTFADEIRSLEPFVRYASAINNKGSNGPKSSETQPKESSDNKIIPVENGSILNYIPPDHKIPSFNKKKEEKEDPKVETSDPLPVKSPESNKQEYRTGVSSTAKVIRVIIADDHTLFREGIKMVLSRKTDIEIVGEAENGMQLLNLLKHKLPDVILLDIQMPVMDGISALTSIRKNYGDIKVIMLTMYNDRSMVTTLMETGANAYLTKMADSESIYEAIKTCHANAYYFNELTNMSLLEKVRSKNETRGKSTATKTEELHGMVKPEDSEKKPSWLRAPKIKKRIIIATCSILLISYGIMAGVSILKHSSSNLANVILPQKTKEAENFTPPADISPAADTKAQQPDTLTKMNPVADSSSGVKTSQELNKNENLTGSPVTPLIAKMDSNKNSGIADSVKQRVPEANDKKTMTRKKLKNLVTVYSNTFIVDSVSGISNFVLTVYNQTSYKLDLVDVEVQILHSDSSLNDTKTLNFKDIPPLSSKEINLPENSMGARIEYKIKSVKSKQLEL